MQEGKCPIWQTDCTYEPKTGDYEIVDSPRAGGRYKISGTEISILESGRSIDFKVRLTDWIVGQHRQGVPLPNVTSDTLDVINNNNNKIKVPYDRAFDLLKFINQKTQSLGEKVNLSNANDKKYQNLDYALAHTSSKNENEISYLVDLCAEEEWIKKYNIGSFVSLTPKGFSKLYEIEEQNKGAQQCFVAMWFDQSLDEIYAQGIVPAIEALNYEPLRVDKKEHINKIDDEIILEIRKSKFIVADLTCPQQKPRGNVYFEAGFAKGLDIPVIWTCKKSSEKDVQFDTQQYNCIYWEDAKDLRFALEKRIGALFGEYHAN